jgi:hypothetical protein
LIFEVCEISKFFKYEKLVSWINESFKFGDIKIWKAKNSRTLNVNALKFINFLVIICLVYIVVVIVGSSFVSLGQFSLHYFTLGLYRLGMLGYHVMWVPGHHGMVHPQVAVGGDGLQVWRIAMNLLNKQLWAANRMWLFSLGVGQWLTTPP